MKGLTLALASLCSFAAFAAEEAVQAQTQTQQKPKVRPVATAAQQAQSITAVDPSLAQGTGSLWGARAGVAYRSLVVVDPDPANDRAVFYAAQLELRPVKGLTTFARFGAEQAFSVEVDDTAFRFQDVALGGWFSQMVDFPSLSRKLAVNYRAQVFLPTSRVSQLQGLYAAPDFNMLASTRVVGRLSAGLNGRGQYRFHRFAERAGLGAGMNTRLVLQLAPFAAYQLWDFGKYGTVNASVNYAQAWVLRYGSRETFASDTSAAEPWFQSYGWSATVSYDPTPYVTASLSLSQGGNVLRNGIVNTFLFHRDETELSVGLSARY